MKYLFIIFLLIFCILPLNAQNFSLEGEVDWTMEGEVEIMEFYLKNNNILTKSIYKSNIAKNKFLIEGNISKNDFFLLSILNEDKKKHINQVIFLEQGKIYLTATSTQKEEKFTCKGSKNQDFISDIMLKADVLYENMKSKNTKIFEENFEKYKKILNDIQEQKTFLSFYYMMLYGVLDIISVDKCKLIYKQNQKENNIWKDAFLHKMAQKQGKKQKKIFLNLDEKFEYIYNTFKNTKLKDENGNQIILENLIKDKYVIIDFWASWCAPCRKEIKNLTKIYNEYKDNKNIVFISISIDKDEIKWKNAIKKNQMEWLQLLDDDTLKNLLEISEIPKSYLLLPNELGATGNSFEDYDAEKMLKYYLKEKK